jgi:hypothetical protein
VRDTASDAVEHEQLACPRCSAQVDSHQEYCLECGLRLPRDHHGALEHATDSSDGEPTGGWALPALVGLAVAVIGTAVALAISSAGDTEAAVSTATGGSLTFTDTGETLTAPEPGTATGTTARPATPAARPPARPPRAPSRVVWPRERRGWTIVLHSFPQSDGLATANERAAEARKRGLRNVGVLDSSRFASLHPGYFVVFTGVFDSQAEASGALQRARAAFPTAYQREIVP